MLKLAYLLSTRIFQKLTCNILVKGIDRKLREYCKRICALLLYTHVSTVTAREKCVIPSQSQSVFSAEPTAKHCGE